MNKKATKKEQKKVTAAVVLPKKSDLLSKQLKSAHEYASYKGGERGMKFCLQGTLEYQIIVQDGINMQDGKIPKINKRVGWNKSVQDGLFHFSLV